MNNQTYTQKEAIQALGVNSPSAFWHLRNTYPSAFVIVQQGTGKGNPTLYDKAELDKFIAWRNSRKEYQP
jgi:hypothetical protein